MHLPTGRFILNFRRGLSTVLKAVYPQPLFTINRPVFVIPNPLMVNNCPRQGRTQWMTAPIFSGFSVFVVLSGGVNPVYRHSLWLLEDDFGFDRHPPEPQTHCAWACA
jgi:hypothetical protein